MTQATLVQREKQQSAIPLKLSNTQRWTDRLLGPSPSSSSLLWVHQIYSSALPRATRVPDSHSASQPRSTSLHCHVALTRGVVSYSTFKLKRCFSSVSTNPIMHLWWKLPRELGLDFGQQILHTSAGMKMAYFSVSRSLGSEFLVQINFPLIKSTYF